jgi:hypothetical protein
VLALPYHRGRVAAGWRVRPSVVGAPMKLSPQAARAFRAGAARPLAAWAGPGRERSELWAQVHSMLQRRPAAPLTADPVPLVTQVEHSTTLGVARFCWGCGAALRAKGRVRSLALSRHWCFACESVHLAKVAEQRSAMLRPDDDYEGRWVVFREAIARREVLGLDD